MMDYKATFSRKEICKYPSHSEREWNIIPNLIVLTGGFALPDGCRQHVSQ